MAIHESIRLSIADNAAFSTLFLILAPFLVTIFYIRHVFKPVGLRPTIDGRRPILPKGPEGVPLFGNLLQLSRQRHQAGAMTAMVGSVRIEKKNALTEE